MQIYKLVHAIPRASRALKEGEEEGGVINDCGNQFTCSVRRLLSFSTASHWHSSPVMK